MLRFGGLGSFYLPIISSAFLFSSLLSSFYFLCSFIVHISSSIPHPFIPHRSSGMVYLFISWPNAWADEFSRFLLPFLSLPIHTSPFPFAHHCRDALQHVLSSFFGEGHASFIHPSLISPLPCLFYSSPIFVTSCFASAPPFLFIHLIAG
jgi:hypothetical protein